ncbi:MAG: hypothetical protein J6H20_06765, partial [Pyramidobacter sp.]|nr:hypothetical protein [Pyramidobacter sp.]
MKKRMYLVALIMGALLSLASAAWAEKLYSVTVTPTHVVNPVTGKTLRGLLYRPVTDEKVPVVLCAHEL